MTHWLRSLWAAQSWATTDLKIGTLIKPPTQIYATADESLRERTVKRRQAAERIRQRAQRVDSGAPVSEVLTMVRKEA